MVDRDDVRTVFFQDPGTRAWHDLEWEHAPGLVAPLSAAAAAYTRRLSMREDRHVDAPAALAELLDRYSKDAVTDRREKNLALRLAAQPAPNTVMSDQDQGAGGGQVVDLLAHLERRRTGPKVSDDLDVFDQYYAEHPDEGAFGVIDE